MANGCISTSNINSGSGGLNDYMLKTKIVPPVCPACPQPIKCSGSNGNKKKSKTCPGCSKCNNGPNSGSPTSSQSFGGYGLLNQEPVPILTDFSTFTK